MHMAQLMPLPLTVSCFSKIQIGFTFLVPAHPGSPGKKPLNGCVCVTYLRRYADHTFIQIYFRMHHFVVKFSKFSSPQAARGRWPPNQNPADVPGWYGRVVSQLPPYIHTHIQPLDNAHNSQAQGLNLRRGRSLGGKRTVDIKNEQTDWFLDEI